MKLVKSLLLGSAAGLTVVAGAQAADLPAKKAAPIEYVRVCSAYGAGFFYIPGTETCLRVSGRARGEAGYNNEFSRRGAGNGDPLQFRGLLRINLDARTQTDYGTLRAFVRLEAASRTGQSKMASGTQTRIGNAFSATGQDAFLRVQDYIVTEKAFIQFAGLTAGRASSFFDFYAHDFEIIASSLGSDVPSTNLFAYTYKFEGTGLSATLSMEDPNFRKTPIYSPFGALPTNNLPGLTGVPGGQQFFGIGANAPTPVILTQGANGNATSVAYFDVVQRARMPDFVGSLRYDAPWGSAQLSAAVKDVNTGGFLGTFQQNPNGSLFPLPAPGTGVTNANATQAVAIQQLLAARGVTAGAQTEYGWAVQGGVKFNLPFIAPGDGLYLQGAYGVGANQYTGITSYSGSYTQSTNIAGGNPFNHNLSDAIVNPLTGKLALTESFTVVASFLHYWTPQWRSAFYGSYGEVYFDKNARAAMSLTQPVIGGSDTNRPPSLITNPLGFAVSPALKDQGQIVTGASLIWSPVKDLDIGVEGQYIRLSNLNGRVLNSDRNVTASAPNGAGGTYTAAGLGRLVSSEDTFQARVRVQRDF